MLVLDQCDVTMTTLPEHIARLIIELRATSEAIAYHRQGCPVSAAVAHELKDLADELDDYSLAIDTEDQTSPRH